MAPTSEAPRPKKRMPQMSTSSPSNAWKRRPQKWGMALLQQSYGKKYSLKKIISTYFNNPTIWGSQVMVTLRDFGPGRGDSGAFGCEGSQPRQLWRNRGGPWGRPQFLLPGSFGHNFESVVLAMPGSEKFIVPCPICMPS